MKKMFLIPIVLAAFVLPTTAQSDQNNYPSEVVTVGSVKITKDKIPSSVVEAVNTGFDKNNPLTWSKFPHSLKDYGWVYEFGTSENAPLSYYEVKIRTTKGGYLRGVYNTAGDLVQTSEISKDIPVPKYIMESLYESPYKDWKVVGNKEVVSFYNGEDNSMATQNFRLKVENGKETKRLAFNYEASTGKTAMRVER